MSQQGDVILFQTLNDGDIEEEGGLISMDGGLRTSAYLLLFGGNEEDDGRENNSLQWWGNSIGQDPNEQIRSRTQKLLLSIPAVSGNLLKIQDAATQDLNPLIAFGAASSISVMASIPALNRVKLSINIDGENIELEENWQASV